MRYAMRGSAIASHRCCGFNTVATRHVNLTDSDWKPPRQSASQASRGAGRNRIAWLFELHAYLTYRIDAPNPSARISRLTGCENGYATQDATYGGQKGGESGYRYTLAVSDTSP